MDKIKYTLRIIATNWIHLVGFYVTAYLSFILFKLIGTERSFSQDWNVVLFLSIFTIPILFFYYGPIIIGGFFGLIIVLDIIGFNLKTDRNKIILLIEWLIIIPPFIFWAFKYDYWLWITLSISLLITQLIREKRIKRIKIKYKYETKNLERHES